MKYFVLLSMLFSIIPTSLNAAYIDTRDLTPTIKQVQRLVGARQSQSSTQSAVALSAAVLALGTGIAVATAYSTEYYHPPYYHRRSYRRPYHNRYYRSPAPAAV
ncbi:MAG: hypothetical protein ACRCTJ_06660, partial [Brevinema sp.]